jgi:hypothetical protein
MHETDRQTVEWSTVSQDILCFSRQTYTNAAIRINKTMKVDIGVGKNEEVLILNKSI